jgi:hypothetical protein
MITKYGFDGKIYFNSAIYATPTWNDISAVQDVSVEATFSEQDATTRAGGGLAEAEPVLLSLVLTGKIRSDHTDTLGFIALETATLARTSIDIMILDGDKATTGSRGYRLDCKNFKFSESQGLDNILFREFELKKCPSANAAYKAVVTAGSPVFTTLAA